MRTTPVGGNATRDRIDSADEPDTRAPDNENLDDVSTVTNVLLIDDNAASARALSKTFADLGHEVTMVSDPKTAADLVRQRTFSLIIFESRIDNRVVLDSILRLRCICSSSRFVVVTAFPSVAMAVRAVKRGVDAFLVKPSTAHLILDELGQLQDMPPGESCAGGPRWPTLNRTVWEYLNQMLATAGSLSEAARRLGIDRRSLRRMLAKYPPSY